MDTQRRPAFRRLGLATMAVLVDLVVTGGSAGFAATAGPVLKVNATYNPHTIPDAIYGMNWASTRLRTALKLPLNRWGGNDTSLYNYQDDTYNNGGDWYFENQQRTASDPRRLSNWIASNKATNTASLVTVPMTGWVANADGKACAFSVAKYGDQKPGYKLSHTDHQWRPDCSDGVFRATDDSDHGHVSGNDPTDVGRKVDPADWARGMVQQLAAQGVHSYALDNEPGLWHDTQRAVHPEPLTRDELMSTSVATAAAIKEADPSAAVLGPSDWGYCGWLYAPADGNPDANCDAPTSGSTEALSAAYVKAFKQYADDHGGQRILTYLDQHYYPQTTHDAPDIALAPSGDAGTQARRLRSTRSLWDPTYKDESWIGDARNVDAPPLQFIRKLRSWASLYPGTKTAITEYNWGGFDSINGALAQADVLGIFGRERLDLATLWNYDNAVDNSWAESAFRIYRNYDGKGGRFGPTGVAATSGDQGRLSVYAAKGSAYLTVVVINKTRGALTSYLRLYNYSHQSAGRAFTLSPASKSIRQTSVEVGRYGLSHTYPAQSVTLLRIARS